MNVPSCSDSYPSTERRKPEREDRGRERGREWERERERNLLLSTK